ncbi:D-alanyl-D-alanine carboxypeptidase family protein [Roseibium sediminicola]|uniref:serine-type D-Ala-D-Ala carboxypeptidase n=1 Tax=Roseibium sediminicola TaxID=2933272 RepID=A0ABT0GRG7_9HYPH|nr:D-alanyl-D-alanine carboxypeptidase family protein [Roseibium sp. CAU 1639]MCK7611440.1 D-alanyl-D-alanine carboxypeptidase [Roseibium sp. CAU 1639]
MRLAVFATPSRLGRVFSCFLTVLLTLALPVLLVQQARAAETIVTKAPMAFLYEPSSGTILFAKAPDQTFVPGALAKVMTAATVFQALKDGDLKLDQLCKVSEHAWRTGGAPSGRGATMFAAIKSEVSVEDLLKGLLVHNGNDSAIVLAECLDGSEQAFAGRMTTLAQKIGMTNSRFANPTGYAEDPSQTTVRDQARLAEYILESHADLYPMFAIPDFTWNNIFQRNKNPLLGEIRNLDGLGGGADKEDGYSGLGSVDRNGRRVIAAVAGLTSDKHRLQTLKEVIEGAWEYFTIKTLFTAGETVADGRVFGGTESSVPLISRDDVNVLLPRGTTLDYRIRVVYPGPISAPVEKGQPAGEIRVIGKDGIVYRAPLVTGAAVGEGPLIGRALDGLQELLFGWIG